jgi:hypothetical protein
MTTTTLPRRRYGSEYPTWAMPLPAGIELPKQVKSVNDRARGLIEQYTQAGQPVGELERAAKWAAPQERRAANALFAVCHDAIGERHAKVADRLPGVRAAVDAGHPGARLPVEAPLGPFEAVIPS